MSSAGSAMLMAQRMARQRVVDAFERAGALSPTTARSLGELDRMDDDVLRALVDEGTVREGAPGTFYLFARELPRAPASPGRIVSTIVFWLVILLLPVAVLQVLNR